MSQENVELVRGAFEDFLARKKDFGAGLAHPEVQWDTSELAELYLAKEALTRGARSDPRV